MRSKKPSLFQQAQKEIKRLQKATKRAVKRGYEFDLPFGRTKEGKPKTRYTAKEVEKLKSLHLKDLYKYSTRYGVSGAEARKEEQSYQAQQAARKRWENEAKRRYERERRERAKLHDEIISGGFKSVSTTIIDNFLARENWRFLKDTTYDKLSNFIYNKINELGKELVAQKIQEATTDGFVSQFQRSYDYQFTVNIMLFDEYFQSEQIEEIKEEQYDEEFEYYDDDFEEYFK